MIDGDSQLMMINEMKQRNRLLERENGFLAAENHELKIEMAEIRALLGSAPDLARMLSKSVNEIAARVNPKNKGEW